MSQNAEPNEENVARRAALWVLVSMDISSAGPEPLLTNTYSTMVELDERVSEVWEQVEERVSGVWEAWDALNEEVQSLSPRWKLERMATVDRNILRLGAWELLQNYRGPLEVINAYVDLSKEYGEKNTPGFVNGLLDQLCQDHKIALRRG